MNPGPLLTLLLLFGASSLGYVQTPRAPSKSLPATQVPTKVTPTGQQDASLRCGMGCPVHGSNGSCSLNYGHFGAHWCATFNHSF